MQALNIKLIKIIVISQLFFVIIKTAQVSNLACNNFYEYACANYSRDHRDPNYNEITQQLDYELNTQLIKYLQNTFMYRYFHSTQQTYNDKMGLYYLACIGEGVRNLKNYFEEIKPGKKLNWPMYENRQTWLTNNETFDLWPLLGQLQSYGLNNIIVTHEITRNSDDSLDIWLAPAWIDEENALPDNSVLQILLITAGVRQPDQIQLLLQQLNSTELKLHNLGDKYSETNGFQDLKYQDLAKVYPNLNLSLYLKNLLGKEVHNINKITLDNPDYFEYLNKKIWSNKELEEICNFFMAKLLYYVAVDSTADFKPLECVKDLRKKFDVAVNYIAYRHFLKLQYNKFENAILDIFNKIRYTMAQYFEENPLKLSSFQVLRLKNKLKAININIRNIPLYGNYTSIQDYYQDIPLLERYNYYKNHLLLLQHRFRKSLLYPQKQTHYVVIDNKTGGQSSPFYVARQNMIIIPVGNLQLPLFHHSQTPLQQLSLFGFILAHELTHAFDPHGLNFDQQGFPLETDSDILDQSSYFNALKCMQDQEPTPEINERIADFFGVRVSFRTYKEQFNTRQDENWKKEFFINLGQFFCGKNKIKFVDHDSDPVRLQQIVKNFPEFSKAFGCLEGSPMNPRTKCRLY